MKKIATAAVAALVLGTSFSSAGTASAWTDGGYVRVAIRWYDGGCVTGWWPDGQKNSYCGGRFSIRQGPIQRGNNFGIRASSAGHTGAVFCEVIDEVTQKVIAYESARNGAWADCSRKAA